MAAFGESPPPIAAQTHQVPKSGHGWGDSQIGTRGNKHMPLGESGHGKMGPAQEELHQAAEPGVLGSVGDLPLGRCMSFSSSLPSLDLSVLPEAGLQDPLAFFLP